MSVSGLNLLAAHFAERMAMSPTQGMGYLLRPEDTLPMLLAAAYGQNATGLEQAFMGMNQQFAPAQFQDLGQLVGQMLFFPLLAELQRAAAVGGAMPMGNGMDLLGQAMGVPPSVIQQYMAVQAAPLMSGDPAMANLLRAAIAGGAVRGGGQFNGAMLPEDVLRALAMEAIKEGRTSQPRSARPRDEHVAAALNENWTPKPSGNSGGVKLMNQGDYHMQLGNGDRTIRQAGCYMTAMTMAATKITGNQNLNPHMANDMIKARGGFSGSSLIPGRAADALGMQMTDRKAVTPNTAHTMQARLDQSLAAGNPVVAGVDYHGGSSSAVSNADHFITITGKNPDGSYNAADPAGGKNITLRVGADGMLHGGAKGYTVSEMTFLQRK